MMVGVMMMMTIFGVMMVVGVTMMTTLGANLQAAYYLPAKASFPMKLFRARIVIIPPLCLLKSV